MDRTLELGYPEFRVCEHPVPAQGLHSAGEQCRAAANGFKFAGFNLGHFVEQAHEPVRVVVK